MMLQEQNMLFLLSEDYLKEYFQNNAWLSCLSGDFLTQFYYYLFAGPAISAAVIFIIGLLSTKSYMRFCPQKVSIIIGLLIEISTTFMWFNPNCRLSHLLSICCGFGIFLLYKKIFKKGDALSAIFTLTASYYVAGNAQIIFAILYAVDKISSKEYLKSIIIAGIVLIIPIAGQRIYQTTYNKNLSYPGIIVPTLPDFYAENSAAIATEYYFGHYDKVEKLALSQKEMSAQASIYYNMVNARKGILTEKISEQKNPELGTLLHIDETTPLEGINLMNDFYYLIGDMSFAERASLMAGVFSPNNRNVKIIKRLCEINLVSGDTSMAMKYIRILEKTLL